MSRRGFHRAPTPRRPRRSGGDGALAPTPAQSRANAAKAAAALKITANDLFGFKLVDEIVPEPLGGAHTDTAGTTANLKKHLIKHLEEILALPVATRLKLRYDKFRAHGHFIEKAESAENDAIPQAGG